MRFFATLCCFIGLLSPSVQAEWLPFTLDNNNITINVEISGQSVKAIFDSGAEINIISDAFAEKFGQNFRKTRKVRLTGVHGSEQVQVYNNVLVNFFGAELDLDNVAAGPVGNSDITLVLGAAFFKNLIVQIDYPNQRLQFFPKRSIDMKKFANVPMERARDSFLPAVMVEANGKKIWLTLDTGNNGAIYLKRTTAIENEWLTESTATEEIEIQGIVKTAKAEAFHLNSLKIGPYELEHIPVQVPAADEKTNVGKAEKEVHIGSRFSSGKQSKGILGYDILKHFVVTVDYANYNLHIVAP